MQCTPEKEPSALTKADLDELAKWAQIGTQLTLGAPVGEKVKQSILALKYNHKKANICL